MKKILIVLFFLKFPIISFADEIFIPVELWLGEKINGSEKIVFPEVNFDKVDKIRGLEVTIVTSSKSKEGTLELLKEFNFPLTEKKN